MPISQTTITGTFRNPDNSDALLTAATFKLIGSDFENGEAIVSNTVFAAVVTEQGDFTASLWPNDLGINGDTNYQATFTFSDGSTFQRLKTAYIRYSDDPKTLEDVDFETMVAGKVKPYNLLVVTPSQFDRLNPKPPNTYFMIKTAA